MDTIRCNEAQMLAATKELMVRQCKRLRQEFVGENEEFLDRLLHQFQAKIARCSWKASQKWCKWNNEGPILMPDYTRLYYRKGVTEILFQEWPPQIRLAKFKGSLLRQDTSEEISSTAMQKTHHFSLAFPYVVFIFKFHNGMFSEVRCAFCDRPLKRLEEKPLQPYLSNIDSNLMVCLGRSFDRNQLETGNIVQQAAYITSYFWQSVYSDEWSSHYWNSKRHFTENNDQRMMSLQGWQKASIENPLFVVEDVHWLPHTEEDFGAIGVRMCEDDRTTVEMGQELYNDFIKEFLAEVKKTLEENLGTVTDLVVNIEPNQLKQDFAAIISGG